jgi:hypothetical protein
MGQDPDRIRQEIEETRGRMTETVEAIGYRADVPGRAKEAIVHRKDTVMGRARGMMDRVVGAAPDMPSRDDVRGAMPGTPGWVPDSGQIRHGADQVVHGAQQAATQVRQSAGQAVSVAASNPIGLAIGAAALGFIAGLAAPVTRMENERLGEIGDTIRDQAKQAGQQALEHGREVVQETARAATETMREAGQEHAGQLADTVREGAHEVRSGGAA